MSRASPPTRDPEALRKKENGRYRYIGQWLTLERQQKKAPFLILFWTQLALTIGCGCGHDVHPCRADDLLPGGEL